MKKFMVAATTLALTGAWVAVAQAANVQGSSSNNAMLVIDKSDFPPFVNPLEKAGLRVKYENDKESGTIDIFGGPVTQVRNAAKANEAGAFFAKLPLLPIFNVAQVWYNDQNPTANVYSIRQLMKPPFGAWPEFGGLVVGQVKGTESGQGVYFGEWSKAVSTPTQSDSTDLHMTATDRIVWYVGDNAVTTMPTLVNAQYKVVGIHLTGTNDNLPHAPNLYGGTLTANYSAGHGAITGAISRGSHNVDFNGTAIFADGTFKKDQLIEGRFYNEAAALAGIYTGGAANEHIAFGGSRSN
ncbi:hypothetical protein ERD78_17160 [Allopusillimonas soli]|uniref:Transferrin-binding protein B C-lobe/N-lobe beta barrel domain-containing protein n=1 Tax=Allopusillimonas soli TaxID=659016 RepID=A0A853FG19_9BURK|nr:Slam-dependent surface lipoprotein [Allopusillimonas soli]NYT38602.1 hypothetical protein [Allopusillimonas soli]TEA71684.1 hypothetical protein ERD78_17160 [Allopusillimonas soli]